MQTSGGLGLGLLHQQVLQVGLEGLVQDELGAAVAVQGALGDLVGQLHGLFHQLLLGIDVVAQAQLLHLGSLHSALGHHQLLGHVHAAGAGQQPVAGAVGDQAHSAEGHHEHGVVSHQGDVAGQQQGGAGAGDGAVSGGDGGLGEVDHLLHEDAGHVVEVEDGLGVVQALHLGDVAAGAEGAALGVDDHAADGVVLLSGVESGGQVHEDLLAHGVQSLGAVEADDADVALNAIQYGFQFHGNRSFFYISSVWVAAGIPMRIQFGL